LQPGVLVSQFHRGNIQVGFTQQMSIRGARTEQNSFLLDGTDVMGPMNSIPGGIGGQSFGVEAVREFRVEAGTFSAQYGRAAGGVINVVTKSGTNELHGSVYEFFRNDNLDAAKWEDNRVNEPKPEFKRNQFGFSLGGPIRKDKTFFFGNYEALRDRQGQNAVANVPTAEARQGATTTVAPYLVFWPLPNGQIFNDGTGEYVFLSKQPVNADYFTGRVDHNFGANDSFFGRYTYDSSSRESPGGIEIFLENRRGRNQFVTLQETHIFSPTLLNTARFGYNRTFTGEPVQIVDPSGRITESLLLQLAFVPGVPLFSKGSIGVTGIEGFGPQTGPRIWGWDLAEWSDDVNLTRGAHSLKFGGLVKKMVFNQSEGNVAGGRYDFGSVADFLIGKAREFRGMLPSGQPDNTWKYSYFGWYVHDDFRVTPRLTLNLGLRHEFYTGPKEKYGRFCWLPDLYDTVQQCGSPEGVGLYGLGKYAGRNIPVFPTSISVKDFAPRVGFAWDTLGDGRTSVRGGFGLFYDSLSPIWWQAPAGSSSAAGSDLQISNPLFPNAYQLAVSGAYEPAFYTGTPGFTAVPYTIQTSFSIQRQLTNTMALNVAYAGSLGRHLYTRHNENIREPITSDGRTFWPAPPPGVPVEDLSLRRNPRWDDVRRVRTDSNSTYHGLLTGFQKRFSQGLQFQASYTFSKAIDNGSNIVNPARSGGGSTGLIFTDNWKLDRSLSDFHMAHNFSFNSTVGLPFGPGKLWGSGLTGVPAALVGGWELGAIVKVASGSYFTITEGGARSRKGTTNAIERPDLAQGTSNNPITGTFQGCAAFPVSAARPAAAPLGTPDVNFDPCAFRLQELGFNGNVGRNTVLGPNTRTLDFKLSKETAIPRITEQFRVQFRAELFNALNRPNFGVPGGAVFDSRGRGSSSAGRITSTTGSARQIQFGLKFLF